MKRITRRIACYGCRAKATRNRIAIQHANAKLGRLILGDIKQAMTPEPRAATATPFIIFPHGYDDEAVNFMGELASQSRSSSPIKL